MHKLNLLAYQIKGGITALKEKPLLSSPKDCPTFWSPSVAAAASSASLMAEEISEIVSRLRIDTEEADVLDVEIINPNPENKISLLLLGRLLTERSFNVEAFKRTITTVWAPVHGVVIRVLRPNLFAFQFFHWRDMLKVLDGRPCFLITCWFS